MSKLLKHNTSAMTGYLVTTTHILRDVFHLGDNAVACTPDNPLPGSVPRFGSMAVVSSLLIDPCGTGGSKGDFAYARWVQWRGDLDTAAAYAAAQDAPVRAVVALRAGALLAVDWLATCYWAEDGSLKLLLWHPVFSGETWLTQFLRLRSMGAKFAGGDAPVGRSLRDAWPHVQPEARTLAGESSWTSPEIACVPTLVEASLAFLTEAS